MKWPKLNLKSKFAPIFSIGKASLLRIWRGFYKQIPRDFRAILRAHHYFVVFGEVDSGKSKLIEGLIEQSQDIYPFEMKWKERPEVQFYLGPKQVIQEVSSQALDNKSVRFRRHLLRLWKYLFKSRDVTAVVTYNCWSQLSTNIRDASGRARSIVGKINLLSEIRKKPISVRVVLTHMDLVSGYLEFSRFLRKQNIAFSLPIDSNFTNETLTQRLNEFYETHLSLILTTAPAEDFIKIQGFFKELPEHFSNVEEFLRIMISREPKRGPLRLEALFLSSESDPNSSFAPFEWDPKTPISIFFKYPMLKHQLAACFLFACSASVVLNNYFTDRYHLQQAKKGVELLELLQPNTFVNNMIPKIDPSIGIDSNPAYISYLPKFFKSNWYRAQNDLAIHIRKHIFEPMFRRILLEDESEIKSLYLLSLMHAARDNRLGDLIHSCPEKWSNVLGIDKNLILTYTNYRTCGSKIPEIPIYSSRIDLDSPLSIVDPWTTFLSDFEEVLKEPAINEGQFRSITEQGAKLLHALSRTQKDEFIFTICNHLSEVPSHQLDDFRKQIKTMQWIRENIDGLENLLVQIKYCVAQAPDVTGKSISKLFAQIKDVCSLRGTENRIYKFGSGGRTYSFELSQWTDHVVTHVVEQMLSSYISENRETGGAVFFSQTTLVPDLRITSGTEVFPHLARMQTVQGRYQRIAYETYVRQTSEKLIHLIEDLPIHPEAKLRFTHFLSNEVISYVKEYQKVYRDLFHECTIAPLSITDFKSTLAKTVIDGSSFHEFLRMVFYQTEIFSSPTPCVRNLEDYNDFTFLQTMFAAEEDKEAKEPSVYQEYQNVLKEMLADLNRRPQQGGFEGLLTPGARVSLDIFRGSPNSYLGRIHHLLDEKGVPTDFHGPFIAPVEHLYTLGLSDLKQAFEMIWSGHFKPKVVSLFSKFPFNRQSKEYASFDEVSAVLNPKGEFWSEIHNVYGVVSKISGTQWRLLRIEDLEIERSIYETLSELASVSSTLWDSEGNPQPIRFKVKGVPFEEPPEQNPVMILSSIVTGKELFHNGNQNPTWHSVKVNWWEEGASAVVVELLNKQTNLKLTRDIRSGDAMWSFFDLLTKGEESDPKTWLWNVSDPTGQDIRTVSICFEKSPWEMIQLEKMGSSEVVCLENK